MQSADYYRRNAEKARRLMLGITPGETANMLEKLARDIATDLERGAIKITNPCLMPQRDHLE